MPVNARPIRIVVERSGPRLEYVLGIIFDDLLGVGWECIPLSAVDPGAIGESSFGDLYYIPNPPKDKVAIHCSGLLEVGSEIPTSGKSNSEFSGSGIFIPKIPFAFTEIPDPTITDVFAWIFYRLTLPDRYEEGTRKAEDQPHQQTQETNILIEDLVFDLANRLNIPLPDRSFDYEITIDVDNPWKYRHKPFYIRWGGLLKDLLKGNLEGFRERWRAMIKKEDPFDTDDLIKEWCPAVKTTLFYLVDGNHPNDSRFHLRMAPYRERVEEMKAAGFGIGIHPSFESQLDEQMIRAQKTLLELVAGPVLRSRQHYLRYSLPKTFQYLLQKGIRYEYSICPKDFTGPMTAITSPYPWYDLSTEKRTDLTLVPAVVMDRSLQQYMKLNPEQAYEKIRAEIARVRRVGGKFVIILHNETFSESGEWKGWREVIRKMLEDLEADGS